jgi:hypothetical protein
MLGNIYISTIKDLILILLFYRVSAFSSYYDEPKKARRKRILIELEETMMNLKSEHEIIMLHKN